jgi:hypothetical protein
MSIDAVVLSQITSAVGALFADYGKQFATEAAKTTWTKVRALLGWKSDPDPAELRHQVNNAIIESPEIVPNLLQLLKQSQSEAATQLVANIAVGENGRVSVVGTIIANQVNF